MAFDDVNPSYRETMSARTRVMPYVVGVRLTEGDMQWLTQLCQHLDRQGSDVLRHLIRAAEPVAVPAPVRFDLTRQEEAHASQH